MRSCCLGTPPISQWDSLLPPPSLDTLKPEIISQKLQLPVGNCFRMKCRFSSSHSPLHGLIKYFLLSCCLPWTRRGRGAAFHLLESPSWPGFHSLILCLPGVQLPSERGDRHGSLLVDMAEVSAQPGLAPALPALGAQRAHLNKLAKGCAGRSVVCKEIHLGPL